MLQQKKEIANKVKQNRSFSNIRSDNRTERKSFHAFSLTPRSERSSRSLLHKKVPDQQFTAKLTHKKIENELLLQKLHELEEKETQMVENLKNAYTSQKEAFQELDKVANETRKPLKLTGRTGIKKNGKYLFLKLTKDFYLD